MNRHILVVMALIGAPLVLAPRLSSADPATARTFKMKCGPCHGEDGKGKTKQGEKMKIGDMTSPAWQKQFPAEKVKATIEGGVKREKNGVQQEMKPLKDKLAPEQIDALVAYVKSL